MPAAPGEAEVEVPEGEAPEAPAAPETPETPDVEPGAPEAGEPPSAEYVDRLRREAADARTELKTFKDTFDGYNDDERAALLDLARTLRTDPQTAAAWMEQVVTNIRGGQPAPETPAPTEPGTPPTAEQPLTLKDLESYMGQREAKATEERLMSEVLDEVKGLGVDPSSTDGIAVMKVAAEQTAGDIKAAYKIAIEDRNQAIIDAWVAQKAADAGTPGSAPPGGTPSTERARPDGMDPMAWSRLLMKERLDNLA